MIDISTIATYGGIIISVLWTAYQELRFQIDKMKKNIAKNMI